jgi:hypothetical protein
LKINEWDENIFFYQACIKYLGKGEQKNKVYYRKSQIVKNLPASILRSRALLEGENRKINCLRCLKEKVDRI